MNLAKFVEGWRSKGALLVRLVSPAGVELCDMTIAEADESGEVARLLDELARGDALPLPRRRQHDYRVSMRSVDNAVRASFVHRVGGGTEEEDDGVHRVDPERIRNGDGVVGHLCKVIVSMQQDATKNNKNYVDLAEHVFKRDTEYTRELEKTNRRNLSLQNQNVKVVQMQIEADERKATRARGDSVLREIFGLIAPVASRIPLLGPVVAEASLGAFRETLTDEQHTRLLDLLGPARFGKLLSLSTPAKLMAWLREAVSPEEMQAIMGMLSQEQTEKIQGAMAAEMSRIESERKKDEEAKKAANGTAAPKEGAPS